MRWPCIALAVALVAGGFWWYTSDQRHGERIEALEDSLSAARDSTDHADSLRAALRADYAADSARWARQFDSLEQVIEVREVEATSEGVAAEVATDSLRSTFEIIRERFPAAGPLVDRGLSQLADQRAHEAAEDSAQRDVIRALRSQLGILQADTASLRSKLRAADRQIATRDEENRLLEIEVRELKSRLDISFLEKLYRDPLVKAGLTLAGFAAGATSG